MQRNGACPDLWSGRYWADPNRVQTGPCPVIVPTLGPAGRPEGLTEHASTFTRPDVLVALGTGLAGARRAVLEELADRFLAERTVSVVADRALEERRWSTPELLAVEQRLIESATGRTGEQAAVACHQAVRDALAAHPTAGPDQQAMVRDLCQGGRRRPVVGGRTGKTSPGLVRHAGSFGRNGAWPRPHRNRDHSSGGVRGRGHLRPAARRWTAARDPRQPTVLGG